MILGDFNQWVGWGAKAVGETIKFEAFWCETNSGVFDLKGVSYQAPGILDRANGLYTNVILIKINEIPDS